MVSSTDTRLRRLAQRIGLWRRTRAHHGRMPEALWQEAASLAEELGTSRVATSLGLGYYGLQQRRTETGATPTAFVELSRADLLGRAPSSANATSIELQAEDGSRLTLRLVPGSRVDVAAVVQAFLGKKS